MAVPERLLNLGWSSGPAFARVRVRSSPVLGAAIRPVEAGGYRRPPRPAQAQLRGAGGAAGVGSRWPGAPKRAEIAEEDGMPQLYAVKLEHQNPWMFEEACQFADVQLDADIADQQPKALEDRQEVVGVRSLDKGLPLVGPFRPVEQGADGATQAPEVADRWVGEFWPRRPVKADHGGTIDSARIARPIVGAVGRGFSHGAESSRRVDQLGDSVWAAIYPDNLVRWPTRMGGLGARPPGE
jgi:hypothetical protein